MFQSHLKNVLACVLAPKLITINFNNCTCVLECTLYFHSYCIIIVYTCVHPPPTHPVYSVHVFETSVSEVCCVMHVQLDTKLYTKSIISNNSYHDGLVN